MKKLLLSTLFLTIIYAHGLHISSAYVTIRNENHISLSLKFDMIELLENYYKSNNKKFDLVQISNFSEKKFEKEYMEIQNLFEKELIIKFNDLTIEKPYFRFFTLKEFKDTIRSKFMSAVIDKKTHSHSHNNYFKMLKVDGFIPKNQKKGNLTIHFPKELEEVMVTFAKPKTKTISPDSNGSNYELLIDVF